MRVAIVHYHLHTGGVTSIIDHAVDALQKRGVEVVVLSGEPPEGRWTGPTRVIETLGYDGIRPPGDPGLLALDLQRAAWDTLGGTPDVWHVHNHSLGKNTALPGALWRLAQEGQSLLLQVHDFPEDGRPANYRRMVQEIGGGDPERLSHYLYPRAPQVHYAVLNARDQGALVAGGCPSQWLHLLPNPVNMEAPAPGEAGPPLGGRRLWLYPTRAIRRKNLGEFLLWASLAGPDEQFATTRAPRNPAERPVYEAWVAFARELDLPVEFEMGERWRGSFAGLLQAAHASVTTSVAEGFGMAFLEPWLMERPVVGRDLPEITWEFTEEGVDLSGLYTRVGVPVDWVGRETVETKARTGLAHLFEAYGRRVREEHLSRCLTAWIRNARIDFGYLDETMQRQVIRHLRDAPGDREALSPQVLAEPSDWETRIPANRDTIRSQYSVERYGDRLEAIYSAVLESPPQTPDALSGSAILSRFLAPERLTLLRT